MHNTQVNLYRPQNPYNMTPTQNNHPQSLLDQTHNTPPVPQMSLSVQDVMIRKVLTIDATQNAKNAARLMTKFGVSSLMVSDEDDIVGILTQRDILTRVVSSGQDPATTTIREIMTEPIIIVKPETPLDEAIKIMFRERIKKLPVMHREDERMKLVGILSITDVARLQPRLIEDMKTRINQTNMDPAEIDFYIR